MVIKDLTSSEEIIAALKNKYHVTLQNCSAKDGIIIEFNGYLQIENCHGLKFKDIECSISSSTVELFGKNEVIYIEYSTVIINGIVNRYIITDSQIYGNFKIRTFDYYSNEQHLFQSYESCYGADSIPNDYRTIFIKYSFASVPNAIIGTLYFESEENLSKILYTGIVYAKPNEIAKIKSILRKDQYGVIKSHENRIIDVLEEPVLPLKFRLIAEATYRHPEQQTILESTMQNYLNLPCREIRDIFGNFLWNTR